MKPKIEELCPNIKHIELVAFVQQKWEKLAKEQQMEYANVDIDQKSKDDPVVVDKRDSHKSHKKSSEKESNQSQDDPKSNRS